MITTTTPVFRDAVLNRRLKCKTYAFIELPESSDICSFTMIGGDIGSLDRLVFPNSAPRCGC